MLTLTTGDIWDDDAGRSADAPLPPATTDVRRSREYIGQFVERVPPLRAIRLKCGACMAASPTSCRGAKSHMRSTNVAALRARYGRSDTALIRGTRYQRHNGRRGEPASLRHAPAWARARRSAEEW
jgi:hypothetical protein